MFGGVAEDGNKTPGFVVFVDEGVALDAIASLPLDGECGLAFFDVHRQRVAIVCKLAGEVVCQLQDPGVARIGGEEDQRPDADDSAETRLMNDAKRSASFS